jgi:hypothetical protein
MFTPPGDKRGLLNTGPDPETMLWHQEEGRRLQLGLFEDCSNPESAPRTDGAASRRPRVYAPTGP